MELQWQVEDLSAAAHLGLTSYITRSWDLDLDLDSFPVSYSYVYV